MIISLLSSLVVPYAMKYWPVEIYQYCVYAKDSNAVSMVMIPSQNLVVSNLRLGLG